MNDRAEGEKGLSDLADHKVVFLLGAGSSYYIGIPMMNGMIQRFRLKVPETSRSGITLRRLEDAGISGDLEETLLQITLLQEMPESGALRAILKSLGSTIAEDPSESDNLRNLRQQTASLEAEIRQFMADECFSFSRENAAEVWGELVSLLMEKRITVFTTNYDYVIEDTAIKRGVKVVDNFKEDNEGRWYWDHTLDSFQEDGLRIVKLHGSVDWYATPDRKTIEKLKSDAKKNREGLDIERLAVFPTRFKDIYAGIFFSLYRWFIKELEATNTLFVVGHSLRDDYIRAAIRESFRRDDFRLVYIGPELPDALNRLSLPDIDIEKKITHVPGKFEDLPAAINYLMKETDPDRWGGDLRTLSTFTKPKRIIFRKSMQRIDPGESRTGTLVVEAPAIPPAMVRASLKPSDPSEEVLDVPITVAHSGEPIEVSGTEEVEFEATITIPDETPLGRYTLIIALEDQSGVRIVSNDYVCQVGRPEPSAEGEKTIDQESDPAESLRSDQENEEHPTPQPD